MSGNVWEWCADVEASTSRYNANENKRAIKGGSWNCIKSYSETKYFKDGKEVFGYKPGYKPRKFDTTKELIKFEDYEYSVDDNNYRSNGYKIANEVSQEQYFNSATIGFRVAVDSL